MRSGETFTSRDFAHLYTLEPGDKWTWFGSYVLIANADKIPFTIDLATGKRGDIKAGSPWFSRKDRTSGGCNMTNAKCGHCGSTVEHPGICPTVKAVEYYEDGSLKRVEYKCTPDYGPATFGGCLAPPFGAAPAAPTGVNYLGIDGVMRCTGE